MAPQLLQHTLFENYVAKAEKLLHRGLDRHLTLAVTGLSGSGKTAFISALVKQLTSQASEQNLPFFEVVRSGRHIATTQVPQPALAIPTFKYREAMGCLLGEPPSWPPSTERINTLRLAIRYRPKSGLRAQLTEQSTLYLDLVDYPGEWLLDLPMMEQTFARWSALQYEQLTKAPRSEYSREFIAEVEQLDLSAPVDEAKLEKLASLYQSMLQRLKKETHLALLQPGRMLMPGDLAGAPLLKFFPVPHVEDGEGEADSNLAHLNQRFSAYVKQVVRPFYQDYFCHFDRQIVLVDLLGALNGGYAVFEEQAEVINRLLNYFSYGERGLLQRLFSPKIDKLLFAANKSDHVGACYHKDLALLLADLVHEPQNRLKFEGISIETMAMSSICATRTRSLMENGETLHCVDGTPLGEERPITYLPPQPPAHRLKKSEWPTQGFDFLSFAPMPSENGQLSHIRLDHVLQFLLGDKLL